MQPSDTSFDRVKSLLGKMDRSIDDARRRRLHDPEEDVVAEPSSDNQTSPAQAADPVARAGAAPQLQPERPASKYGRARPLRDLSAGNGPNWQTA